MVQFPPDSAVDPSTYFKTTGNAVNPFTTARSAMAGLRGLWNTKIYADLPPEVRKRLDNLEYPLLTSLAPMDNTRMAGRNPTTTRSDWDTSSMYSLIPWSKLTLAGMRCQQYKVRAARLAAARADVIIPDWPEFKIEEGDKRKVWLNAWKFLCWKYRPEKHYEIYWRLLHRRATYIFRRNSGVPIADVSQADGMRKGLCNICGERDTNAHAYMECRAVQIIWVEAKEIMEKLLGWAGNSA
jgi:hypothetical protein